MKSAVCLNCGRAAQYESRTSATPCRRCGKSDRDVQSEIQSACADLPAWSDFACGVNATR